MTTEDGKGKRRSTSPPRARKSPTRIATSPDPVASAVEIATAASSSVADIERLLAGEHLQPHSVLGAHPATRDGVRGVVVRALAANATHVESILDDGGVVPLDREAEGLSDLYGAFLPGKSLPLAYRFRITYADGVIWER